MPQSQPGINGRSVELLRSGDEDRRTIKNYRKSTGPRTCIEVAVGVPVEIAGAGSAGLVLESIKASIEEVA